jgi:ribonucleoside-diphosphate reductase alpha chain
MEKLNMTTFANANQDIAKGQSVYTHEEAMKMSLEYFDGDNLAASVFVSKYAMRDQNGNILEPTPNEMHRRLAKEFARIEKNYSNALSEEEICNYFKDFQWIIPQGSPMSAIGNDYQIQSCSNCFVIPSPEDSYGGILKTDQEQAQIMKRRGGVGFDISHIRPKGIITKNAARTTDGIGVFMERFSNTCREVAQNGRRGALMLTISCHHPEIRTFINIKKDKTKVTGANISIRLSDEFMNAVKNKSKVELRWPVNSSNPKVRQEVDAVELWKEIIHAAWESAEPGSAYFGIPLRSIPHLIFIRILVSHRQQLILV